MLLEVFDDRERGVATRDDVLGLLGLIDSYVLRRAICDIPTNTLNRTFQGFGRSIDKAKYLESSVAAFQMLDSYRRFPTDEEFKRDFMTRDIYNLTARRNYILRKLENHNRKEVVNVESFTIEHVMPQNERLSTSWRSALGSDWKRIQATHLHTIGNLTLTGYNSELSDRPFTDKRDMTGGFRDSPIRLNKDLARLETWNEETIMARAARMADRAMEVWPGPRLSAETLESYRQASTPKGSKSYTLHDHPLLKGVVLVLFESLRTRIMNLDPSVSEEILKAHIAYKTSTSFVDVVPQKSWLRLILNMELHEVDDPRGWCKDVTDLSRWSNGDIEVHLLSVDQLDYVMSLIRQSFAKQTEESVV